MTVTFGRALRCALATASTLTILAGGAAFARDVDHDARLEALLGSARAGAEVTLQAQSERLPSPTERSVATVPLEADVEKLIAQAEAEGDEEWQCLTEALYFEARGEPLDGQIAVAEVILNRRDSGRYPDTICGVVRQGTGKKWMCQFSYYCDGLSDEPQDRDALDGVGRVARVMLDGAPRELTDGALFYHADYVSPYWADQFHRTAQVGLHIFYVEDQLQMASNASN